MSAYPQCVKGIGEERGGEEGESDASEINGEQAQRKTTTW